MSQKYPISHPTCVHTSFHGKVCGLAAETNGVPHGWLCPSHLASYEKSVRGLLPKPSNLPSDDDMLVAFIIGQDAAAARQGV